MGKQSKHMKHKCIYYNDLRKENEEAANAKCYNKEAFVSSAAKTLAGYKKKYDTSMKSELK